MLRLLFFLILLIIGSCSKEPLPRINEGYNPTLIDPATIFPVGKFGMPSLPKDNPLTKEGIYLGRMLFYDPILSLDSSIFCGSCHIQENAFADSRKFSNGIYGLPAKRNSSGLMNLAFSRKFFWDARQSSLREQIFEPIQDHNEMAMPLPLLEERLKRNRVYIKYFNSAFGSSPNLLNMSKAIEQFLLTLVSKDSRFNEFWPGKFSLVNESEKRGSLLFFGLVNFDPVTGLTSGADCFHCHGGPLVQSNNPNMGGIANNGLDLVFSDPGLGGITGNPAEIGTFKTPTLLNVAVTAPYMHDGRFSSLDQVINFYSDSVKHESPTISPMMAAHENKQMKLSPQQKADLKAFLMTMTDNSFLSNPDYSNPFKK